MRKGDIAVAAFAARAEACAALLAALPPPYARAMDEIVTRLQSSALFSAESCSFSQEELHNALSHWLNKAQQKLGA
ncbi:MAG: hypothetical protein EAZ24_04145 [Burkholderiales bacterium]|nr:MAG: hypothetical protein EAZ24_04145 [Burkholderiales bacterium]TAG82648.1 MAG: hypothetical protein EAZ21_03180 [Betaproteobacteria bacterium]